MARAVAQHAAWLVTAIAVALVAPHVYAQPLTTGLVVSPAIEQITLAPGQSSASFTLQVVNRTGKDVTLAAYSRDFTTLNQSGGIRFLDDNSGTSAHSLAGFMHISNSEFSLQPNASASVSVTVSNASKLAAGGHYAAVVFQAAGTESVGSNSVRTSPAVSSLVFVTTAGMGTQELKLVAPNIGSLFAHMPDSLDLVFANDGNTQTTLRGVAQVTDSSGRPISQGIINVDSGLILPGSQRLFSVALQPQSNTLQLLGQYTLHILYRHDGQDKYAAYEAKFFYVNAAIIWSSLPFALVCTVLVVQLAHRKRGRH